MRFVKARLAIIFVFVAVIIAGCGFPPAPPPELHGDPFLVCTRAHESDRDDVNGNGLHDAGYATNTGNGYYGAYQFLQSTWDKTAEHADWPALIGVRPNTASVDHQDMMAWALYEWYGKSPWGYRC